MKDKDTFFNTLNRFLYQHYLEVAEQLKQASIDEQTDELIKFVDDYCKIMNKEEEKEFYYDEIVQLVYDLVTSYEKSNPEVFEDKYEPWVDEIKNSISWQFSDRYNDYLMGPKNWDLTTINSINTAANVILDHCGNPLSGKPFTIKGLVVGDIQSGKTANYTSLINKALDVGYKLIIVLAGITNDLRSQTQKRLDKEVIGFQTLRNLEKGMQIGVGCIKNHNNLSVNCLTDAGLDGDLRKVSITYSLDEGARPLLIVVKKNTGVLESLVNFIKQNPSINHDTGKLAIPTLIIDDEADQASLNTNKKDDIEKATAINRKIRILLSYFTRFSYVGYTATPFANAFVNPFVGIDIPEDDKDVFPEDFIITLKTPETYSGVVDFFGNRKYEDEYADGESFNLDLFRPITEADVNSTFGNKQVKAAVDSYALGLPDSLKEAIKHFLIAAAIKETRGIFEHTSMLIHVTHYVDPNKSLKPLVIDEVDKIIRRCKFSNGFDELKSLWEEKIAPISHKRLGDDFKDNWDEIQNALTDVFTMLQRDDCIVSIGGKSDDTIDYDSASKGVHIVIGGNKLSRGLTLEGLVVSYYYRNARAYDTLLQMGRWFGYRQGWLDVCRIYTTKKILNDFISSSEALESFKDDIKVMNKLKYTPKQFGLKVATSPKLVPTSIGKMRHAKRARISFSGDLQQTISFDKTKTAYNRDLTLKLLNKYNHVKNSNGKYVFKNVCVEDIIDYLGKYAEAINTRNRISVSSWKDYIEKMSDKGELKNWTIVLHSLINKTNINKEENFGGYKIIKPRRKNREGITGSENNFAIKVLTNPADFLEYYDEDNPIRKCHTQYDAGDDDIRQTFTSNEGLLTIYVFDVTDSNEIKEQRKVLEGGSGLVGLGLWFPISSYSDCAVDCYINHIYEVNGGRELDDTGDEEEYDD